MVIAIVAAGGLHGFDVYQSAKDARGRSGRHGFTKTYALWEENCNFLHHVHCIIDARIEPWRDRLDSSVAFQTQYVRNKILSIAALDYKISAWSDGRFVTRLLVPDLSCREG